MLKPKDYDNTPELGNWKPLAPGGYVCKILLLDVTKSATEKPMIALNFDICEGDESDRFRKEYTANTYPDRKWGAIMYQLIYDKDGNTAKGFKTMMVAIEKSNPTFELKWLEDERKFSDQFKNKYIGILFGREEYAKKNSPGTTEIGRAHV